MVSFIKPYNRDPFVGHLSTPITSSAFTNAYLKLLPAYRPDLTPFSKGTEIGFVHGYFLLGPFYTYGPLRSSVFSLTSLTCGVLATLTLMFILTMALSLYGAVTFDASDSKSGLQSSLGWKKFSEGFLGGGLSGTIVAGALVFLYNTYL